MKDKRLLIITGFLMIALAATACGQATPTEETPPTAPPTEPASPTEVIITGSASVGGRLYDKWWKEAVVDEPSGDQTLWASQSTNARSGSDTWRCKECHGWDYQGAAGAYGSGSHFTGFPGILDPMASSPADLLAAIDGSDKSDHDFSAMGEEALRSLVVFMSEDLVDVSPYIDPDTKSAIGGDAAMGAELYADSCTACHGEDGRAINFGDEEEPEYVGNIALDNPWEFIHKVRAGQPGTAMPSAIDSGWSLQDVVDVLAYSQTLPTEASAMGSIADGGKLYDKWWVVAGVDEPEVDNPIWARQDINTRSGSTTWRCKECHGWDYMGAAGAYGSGSHYTGFPGVLGAQDKSFEDLLTMLTGGVDPEHDFSAMGESALNDLVTFLQEGLMDVSSLIDSETKAAIGGDASNGGDLYAATCAACHGEDGRMINFGDEEDPEYVGTIALGNPWEFLHKVRAGQPGTGMPSSIDLGWILQNLVDILLYAQSLPTEAP
jgi:mono/diheme cytochrome c family protein/ribosomal protein L37AE/L43A